MTRGLLQSGRSRNATVGQVTMADQQTVDRDIFVQRIPVNAHWTELEFGTLFGGGRQQSGKPRCQLRRQALSAQWLSASRWCRTASTSTNVESTISKRAT